MHLTVIQPFGDYARGEKIYEQEEIDKVLKGENSSFVVKTADQMMNGAPHVPTKPN
jgi:hypothetical protein